MTAKLMTATPEQRIATRTGMRRRLVLVALLATVALVAAACDGDGDSDVSDVSTRASDHMGDGGMMGDDGMGDHMDDDHIGDDHGAFAFGEPVDAAEAGRVVEIEMSDEFRFTPDEVPVAVGETITFRLHNGGELDHDFTIGDAKTQDEHDAEMAGMGAGMMHSEGNAVTVGPGETEDLTWRFTEVEGVLFGCHFPGHYDAGMKGTFTPAG